MTSLLPPVKSINNFDSIRCKEEKEVFCSFNVVTYFFIKIFIEMSLVIRRAGGLEDQQPATCSQAHVIRRAGGLEARELQILRG